MVHLCRLHVWEAVNKKYINVKNIQLYKIKELETAHSNDWETLGLYRKFTDKVTGQEILTSNLELQRDPRFYDINFVLNDFTPIIDFDITNIDITKITVMDNVALKGNPNIKIAIVATLELFRKWVEIFVDTMKGTPFECTLFDSVEDARKWISK